MEDLWFVFSLQLLKFYFILILQLCLKTDSRMIQYYNTVDTASVIHQNLLFFSTFLTLKYIASYFQNYIFEITFSYYFFSDHSLFYRWSNDIFSCFIFHLFFQWPFNVRSRIIAGVASVIALLPRSIQTYTFLWFSFSFCI